MKIEQFLSESYEKGTFLHIAQKFLAKREDRLSPSSITHLLYTLRPCGKALNNPPISTVKSRTIKTYVDSLWLKYASGTIRGKIGDLQQFGRWCAKKGHIKKDFARHLKKPKLRTNQPAKAPQDQNIRQLITHLTNELKPHIFRNVFGLLDSYADHQWSHQQQQSLRDLFIISFLYETGCRAGELCNLSAKALNQATQAPAKTYTIVTGVGKTNDHDYHFTNTTAELWKLWYTLRPDQNHLHAIYGWRKGGPCTPLLTNGLSQMMVRRCQKANIRPFRAHSLRHAKIKRSRQIVGMDLAQILVDHADPETTWGYAGIDNKELEQAVLSTGLCYDLWSNG